MATIKIKLTEYEKYHTSIYEQLEKLKVQYPDYDIAHAKRTEEGWEIVSK